MISWVKESDRWNCYNEDGSIHWDKCNEIRTKQAMREGRFVKGKDWEGYQTSRGILKTKHVIRSIGELYTGSCDCESPPWEVCPHSFKGKTC